MRKRSDVVGARQQDLDATAKPLEQTAVEARAGLRHYECPKCHAKQSAGVIEAQGGKCIRCGEPIPTGVGVKSNAEFTVAKTEPAPPPRAEDAPGTPREVPRQPMGGEVPFTQLQASLERHGYSASMVDIAKWTPEQRAHAQHVCVAYEDGFVDKGDATEPAAPWLAALRRRSGPMGEAMARHAQSEPGDALAKGAARVVDVGPAPDIKVPDSSSLDPKGGIFGSDVGETVSAAWGEEKFTPIKNSFSVCTVGPFVGATKVRPGETRAQAATRVMEELREVARAERDRKLKEFIQKLKSLSEELRGAEAN